MINIQLPDLKPLFDAFPDSDWPYNVAKNLVRHVKPLTLKIDGLLLLWQDMTASLRPRLWKSSHETCGLNRHDRRKVSSLSRRALRKVYGR